MSLTSFPPGAEEPTDIVSRKVFINNTELSNEVLLLQLVVTKLYNKIASAKLVFQDGAADIRDFPLSNDSDYKPGNAVKVQLGYDGNVDTVFEGIIVKHGVKVQASGVSILVIEAKDKAVKLTGARKSKYFVTKKDSEIIEALAGDGGLNTDVQTTTETHKQMVQFDVTDWDFLLTRAEANGMLAYTDDNTLVVKKPAVAASELTALYGHNIREFEAEMDARHQLQSVGAMAWNYTKQKAETIGSGSSSFTETGNLSSGELSNVLAAAVTLQHTGFLTPGQLQGWADTYAMRSKLSKAVGRVCINGNAALKPGSTITLEGVGDRFNGDVLVTGVLHQYDGTWYTDVQFGWNEALFVTKEEVMPCAASGLLPGINGLQIGLVKDVNDTEAGGQYRVKVHVPMITGSSDGMWARVATLDAGAQRGVYFRPQVDDEVVLGFLNDDPREPVILGYLHSKDKHKSPFADTSDSSQVFGIVTKQKLKIEFDDTNKKMTLFVPVSGENGKKIVLDANGSIELKDELENSIKMGTDGITIKAGTGKNVTIKGTQVLIN